MKRITVVAFLMMALCGHAAAQAVASVSTPLDLKKCTHKSGKDVEDYGEWRCAGYDGIPVLVTAGDSRSYVSFGTVARRELAIKETLASFNGAGRTIEWRGLTGKGGKITPYAATIRYSTLVTGDDDKQTKGEVLVVFRVPPGGACHIGYVDAKANNNAQELAYKIADENARGFACGSDKAVVAGVKGPGFSGPYGK
jgi:hypothetical protein